ncbi:PREDICTED: sushi, von Willebrand factor type A, EGF and pentraxin domain-containing protein 1-like, partial [Eurypyga helias]|uniref:sushi, von Willebrand factor type A, EGF and pentraxin domain-containing protein 1-like n=1 Tax=Eurypyga helias TaxID=54383 RepID=UPI000528EF6B
YTLVGPATIECLASGEWSVSNQQCLAVSCDEPPQVENASPESGHRLFGDTAYYFCSDGYSLADNSQLLCNAEGKWVPPEGREMPHCIADFCEKPSSVSYSILESISKARFAAGSVVSFKCMEGFVLNTSAKIECLRGGQWNPSPLSIQCIPIRCGDPPNISNGYASGANYSFGAVVAYSCNKGFYIKGEKKRTCEATGNWSGSLPTCHPVSCGEPPQLENGFIKETTGRFFENQANYQCESGYQLVGSSVFICQANRQWYSESPPYCVPLSCGKPPPIQHGYSRGETFDMGSKVEFFCDEGYELIGDVSWTCQKSGKWNKKQSPKCVPTKCPEPPLVESQLVLREVTYQVGVVQFSCKEGYVLHGSSVLKCLPSQQWNDSFPFCKVVQCPAPPYIPFGDPLTTSLHFGSTVRYICVDGFLLKGESAIRCQADGSWSLPLPECIPVECPQPEEIQNGIVDVQGLTFLSTALYTCKSGFELVGNTTILCGEDGQWLGGRPACKPIQCPRPKKILNGKYSFTNFHYGQTTCEESGWSSSTPACLPTDCGLPPHIDFGEYVQLMNGNVRGENYTYGSVIYYECDPGYQLNGPTERKCQENQKWDGSEPICIPVSCSPPPVLENGQIQNGVILGTDFSCGKSAQFHCLEGFKLLGPSEVTCEAAGKWSSGFPRCGQISCGSPPVIPNTFINGSGSADENTIIYTCLTGFVMRGSPELTCVETGVWKKPYPSCELLNCGPPPSVPNAEVLGDTYSDGSKVQY